MSKLKKKESVEFEKKEKEGSIKETIPGQREYLRFLIKYGYIDENYRDYLFENESRLSSRDLKLLREIRSGEKIDFNTKIDDINSFINELSDDDFKNECIMIRSVLANIDKVKDYDGRNPGSDMYGAFLNFFMDESNSKFISTLIDEYMKQEDDKDAGEFINFFDVTSDCCLNIFVNEILKLGRNEGGVLEKSKTNKIAVGVLKRFCKKSMPLENDEPSFRKFMGYIGDMGNYMELFKDVNDEERIKDLIKSSSIKFKILRGDLNDDKIQRYIINGNYYEINVENLKALMGGVNDVPAAFYVDNYNFIMTSGDDNLKKYIKDNLDVYIENVWGNDKIKCGDIYTVVKKFIKLKKTKIIKKRNAIIGYCKKGGKFDNVGEFDTKLYETFLECNGIVVTWSNIVTIYKSLKFDGVRAYIERHAREFPLDEEIVEINAFNDLIADIEKNMDSKIEPVVDRIPVLLSLNELVNRGCLAHKEGMLVFISSSKISYSKEDYLLLHDYKDILCKYIGYHDAEIQEDFDGFYEEYEKRLLSISVALSISKYSMPAESYNVDNEINMLRVSVQDELVQYMLSEDVGIKIKEKLIDVTQENAGIVLRVGPYADNSKEYRGFERAFADYIIKNNKRVNDSILWQFTFWGVNWDEDEKNIEDKFRILDICNYGMKVGEGGDQIIDAEYKMNISRYLMQCSEPYKLIFEDGENNIELDKTKENERLIRILKDCDLITLENDDNHDAYIVNAKMKWDGIRSMNERD